VVYLGSFVFAVRVGCFGMVFFEDCGLGLFESWLVEVGHGFFMRVRFSWLWFGFI